MRDILVIPKLHVVQVALRAVTLLAISTAGLVGVGRLLYTQHLDPLHARRVAERELGMALEPGEAVELAVPAFQRHWWDYFRPTRGVFVVTDRRMMFVGLPPRSLLGDQDGPQPFEAREFPLDTAIFVGPRRVFVGTTRGFVVRAPNRRDVFGIASRDAPRVQAIVGTLTRRQEELRAIAEQERLAQLAALEAARQPVYHTVKRGEALALIAEQYGTTPEQLRQMNGLPSDRIRAGQRLLVKPGS